MTRLASLFAALLGLVTIQTPTFAAAIYDASVFLSVSSPGVLGTNLTLFPGIAFTPPPLIIFSYNATATNSATASIPGQIQAAASGGAFGSGEGIDAFARSQATAVGFGSLTAAASGLLFPLLIHEEWSVAVSEPFGSGSAAANIRLAVLLDTVVIYSNSAHVALSGGPRFLAHEGDTALTLNLSEGSHSLLFTVDADGLAATPEPTSLVLLGSSLAGLGAAAWRRVRVHRVRMGGSS